MARFFMTGAVAALALVACQERLAAPADCPELCPGNFDVRDTILVPVVGSDSSFEGYIQAGQGSSLRVSWQFPVSEDRAIIRFISRPDSFTVGDSTYPYTIDSVTLGISVVVRDTSVKGLKLLLYRMPATVDSTVTFTDLDTAFTDQNLVDTIAVADSLVAGRLQSVLKEATLARVAIAGADSGVLALGVQIRADNGTGVRIGGSAGGTTAPTFVTHLQVDQGDTVVARTLTRSSNFSRFVSQAPPAFDPDLLTIGGVPSARTVLRFPWPAYLRDSAQLVRVSLELLPTAPIAGLTGDTAFVQVRPLLADLGSKSPASTDGLFISFVAIPAGLSDTVRTEVRRAVSLWQGEDPLPSAFLLQVLPEGSSFTRATFGSSRTPGLSPRLRVTYARKFPFEAP